MTVRYDFYSKLDSVSKKFRFTRTSSLYFITYRLVRKLMLLGYNSCRPGYAAVSKPRTNFLAQWHCLISRVSSCNRPTMVLLRSCVLRIRTEIGWKPEIQMTHIDSSHNEKLSY